MAKELLYTLANFQKINFFFLFDNLKRLTITDYVPEIYFISFHQTDFNVVLKLAILS